MDCVLAARPMQICACKSVVTPCRILKEERNYILQMIKKIRASGANVLLIQKSILRDAVTDLSLHYLVSCHILNRCALDRVSEGSDEVDATDQQLVMGHTKHIIAPVWKLLSIGVQLEPPSL